MQTQPQVKSSSNKLVVGCGIGCGAVVLLLILAGVGIYTYINHTIRDVEEIDRLSDEIDAAHGKISEYTPYETPFIPARRIEKFITIRDSINNNSRVFIEAIDKMEQTIRDEEEKRDETSFWDLMDIIGSGLGIIPHIIENYYERAYWLKDNRMGYGEYYYLYVTSYYCFLGKSPGDGPKFQFSDMQDSGIHIEEKDEDIKYGDKVVEQRNFFIRQRVNEIFRTFFANALKDDNIPDKDYRLIIEKEWDKLRQDKFALPWEEGLPPSLSESFEPFRSRLENSYQKYLNPLEFKNKNDFK